MTVGYSTDASRLYVKELGQPNRSSGNYLDAILSFMICHWLLNSFPVYHGCNKSSYNEEHTNDGHFLAYYEVIFFSTLVIAV